MTPRRRVGVATVSSRRQKGASAWQDALRWARRQRSEVVMARTTSTAWGARSRGRFSWSEFAAGRGEEVGLGGGGGRGGGGDGGGCPRRGRGGQWVRVVGHPRTDSISGVGVLGDLAAGSPLQRPWRRGWRRWERSRIGQAGGDGGAGGLGVGRGERRGGARGAVCGPGLGSSRSAGRWGAKHCQGLNRLDFSVRVMIMAAPARVAAT